MPSSSFVLHTTMANGIPNGRPNVDLFFDIVIVGAGIAAVNAAYRIQTERPDDATDAILEGRDAVRGTWDLFRYPGIRSDSDIFPLAFPWTPCGQNVALASRDQVKSYMK